MTFSQWLRSNLGLFGRAAIVHVVLRDIFGVMIWYPFSIIVYLSLLFVGAFLAALVIKGYHAS